MALLLIGCSFLIFYPPAAIPIWVRNAFASELDNWCGKVDVNYRIYTIDHSSSSSAGFDGVNLVSIGATQSSGAIF